MSRFGARFGLKTAPEASLATSIPNNRQFAPVDRSGNGMQAAEYIAAGLVRSLPFALGTQLFSKFHLFGFMFPVPLTGEKFLQNKF